jgi:hypothetical protein
MALEDTLDRAIAAIDRALDQNAHEWLVDELEDLKQKIEAVREQLEG